MTFLLNPNCLKFSDQSFSLSLSLSLSLKQMASIPIKTFNCLPLDLKPYYLVFLYIGFELLSFHPISHQITTRIGKSTWGQISFFSIPWTSLLFCCNFLWLVLDFLFLGCKYHVSFFFFSNFQLIVYFFVFMFTIFLYIIMFYPLKLFVTKELECVLLI